MQNLKYLNPVKRYVFLYTFGMKYCPLPEERGGREEEKRGLRIAFCIYNKICYCIS